MKDVCMCACSLQNSSVPGCSSSLFVPLMPRNHQRFNLKLEVKNLVGSSSHSWWLQAIQNHRKKQKNIQVTDIRQLEITYDHLKKMVKIIKMTPHTIGFRSPSHLQASHCSTSTSESHLMGI
jgi:hypothetical protein